MPEFDAGPLKCEMPMSMCATCEVCVNLGPFMNCPNHMRVCNNPVIYVGCNDCSRVLCYDHRNKCYCEDVEKRAAFLQPTRRVRARAGIAQMVQPGIHPTRGSSNNRDIINCSWRSC